MTSGVSAPTSAEGRLRALAHSLLVVVSAFGVGIVLGIPGTFALALLGFSLSPPSVWVMAVTSALQYVGFMAVVEGYRRYAGAEGLVRIGVPTLRDVLWMAAGLVGLFVSVAVVSVVITAIGAEQAQNTVVTQGRRNPTLFLVMVPIALLFIGPGEEVVFRGVVQGLLARAYGTVPAIFLASVLFGIAHYAALAGSGKLTYIAVTILLGLVLGGIYEWTDNIVVPSVVHGVYNAILFASQWFAAVNDVPLPS